jgi:hypothetical protein
MIQEYKTLKQLVETYNQRYEHDGPVGNHPISHHVINKINSMDEISIHDISLVELVKIDGNTRVLVSANGFPDNNLANKVYELVVNDRITGVEQAEIAEQFSRYFRNAGSRTYDLSE